MDKRYDDQTKDIQSQLVYIKDLINKHKKHTKASPAILEKIEKLCKYTEKNSMSVEIIMKLKRTVQEIMWRCDRRIIQSSDERYKFDDKTSVAESSLNDSLSCSQHRDDRLISRQRNWQLQTGNDGFRRGRNERNRKEKNDKYRYRNDRTKYYSYEDRDYHARSWPKSDRQDRTNCVETTIEITSTDECDYDKAIVSKPILNIQNSSFETKTASTCIDDDDVILESSDIVTKPVATKRQNEIQGSEILDPSNRFNNSRAQDSQNTQQYRLKMQSSQFITNDLSIQSAKSYERSSYSKPSVLPDLRPGLLSTPTCKQEHRPYHRTPAFLDPNKKRANENVEHKKCAQSIVSYKKNETPLTCDDYRRPRKDASKAMLTKPAHIHINKFSSNDRRSGKNLTSIVKAPSESILKNFQTPKKTTKDKVGSNEMHTSVNWNPKSMSKQVIKRPRNIETESKNSTKTRNCITTAAQSNENRTKETNITTASLTAGSQANQENTSTNTKELHCSQNVIALLALMKQLSKDNPHNRVKETLTDSLNQTNTSMSNKEGTKSAPACVQKTDVTNVSQDNCKNELGRMNKDVLTKTTRNDMFNDTRRREPHCNTVPERNTKAKKKSNDYIVNKKLKTGTSPKSAKYVASALNIETSHRRDPTLPTTQRSKTTLSKSSKTGQQLLKVGKKSANVDDMKKPRHTFKTQTLLKPDVPSRLVDAWNGRKMQPRNERQPNHLPKRALAVQKPTVKNINPEWHSLKKVIGCQLCDKPHGSSLVSHYVNCHPNSEVFISRLAPDVAELLRKSGEVNKCKIVRQPRKDFYELKQFCYFCNVYKCFTTNVWIGHLAKHTGYYQFKCNVCARIFSEKPFYHACEKKKKNNLVKIPQPQFEKEKLKAYVCDLCNFIRFNKIEIVKHLSCEHGHNVSEKFKKVMFLNLPKRKKKNEVDEEFSNEYDSEVSEDFSESEDLSEREDFSERQDLSESEDLSESDSDYDEYEKMLEKEYERELEEYEKEMESEEMESDEI